jgi:hypothetical protein
MITDVYFDRQSGLMQSGFVSAQYVRPNPPEGPLHHRYVFLLYEQPLLFIPPVFGNQLRGARAHFNLPLFTLDYGLGAPAAGESDLVPYFVFLTDVGCLDRQFPQVLLEWQQYLA